MISWRSIGVAVLLTLVSRCALRDGTAWAVSGGLNILPMSTTVNGKATIPYSGQSGLQISVDTTWVGTRGYRPVQVSFSSPTPLAADVQLTVRFHAGFWRNKHRSIIAEQDLEMRRGISIVSTTLMVPQYVDWNGFGWEVWVDGEKDKQLSTTATGFNQPNAGNSPYSTLVLQNGTKSPLAALALPPSLVQMDALSSSVSQLPEKWIGYTNLDMVVANPDDLEQWNKNFPERLTEMLRWVRSGGNLWVFDVGEEYVKLASIETSLGLNLKVPSQRGWQFVPLHGQARQDADALVMLEGRMKKELKETASPMPEADSKSIALATDSRNWFMARAHGMGTVVAFRQSFNKFSSPEENVEDGSTMQAVELSLLEERLYWSRRHGNDPGQENHDFNEWLIPDVGAAPVFEFQLLISLFVIGIGPLNYWILKRRGQLPLMLVTVPAAALATTVILFAYGILGDGFSVRVRSRSLTLIDQVAGEATCWARTSYYAGLAPAKGLQMPDDMVIYPIHPSRSGTDGSWQLYAQEQREVEWGNQQNLTRGWLASRTPTQYLSIAARPSNKRLEFESQGDRLTVTNELGVAIVWLAVQDLDGGIYVGEVIDSGTSAVLQKSELIPAMSQLRTMINDNIPELPAGLALSQNQGRSRGEVFGSRYSSLSYNLMEVQINSVVSPLIDGWGNGSYIAITSAGPELTLGLEEAIESNSFHVVRGSWANE